MYFNLRIAPGLIFEPCSEFCIIYFLNLTVTALGINGYEGAFLETFIAFIVVKFWEELWLSGPAEQFSYYIEEGSRARIRNILLHFKFIQWPKSKKIISIRLINSLWNVAICGAPHNAFVPNVCHFLTWLCQHSDVYVGTGMTRLVFILIFSTDKCQVSLRYINHAHVWFRHTPYTTIPHNTMMRFVTLPAVFLVVVQLCVQVRQYNIRVMLRKKHLEPRFWPML